METLRQVSLPDGLGQTRGSEHEVWISPDGRRVIKATHPGEHGRVFGPQRFATQAEYFERIRRMNEEFCLDWRVEGVHGSKKRTRIVTSQPLFAGEPPSHIQIQKHLRDFSFRPHRTRFGDAWFRKEDGLLISDAEPKNAVLTRAGIIPFDFLISRPTRDLLEASGIK